MASQQRRGRRLPQSNANDYAAGKSDAYTHSYGLGYNYAGKSDADCYGYDHATSVSYAHGDNHAETYADAKATAHAVSSSDAVSEWVKKLKSYKVIGNSRGNSRVPCFVGL